MRRFAKPGKPTGPEGIRMIFGSVNLLELSKDQTWLAACNR